MTNERRTTKTALNELAQISDLLAVPTLKEPLKEPRKWTLPKLEETALQDHQKLRNRGEQPVAQAPLTAKEAKSAQPSNEGSTPQTRSK